MQALIQLILLRHGEITHEVLALVCRPLVLERPI